MMTDEEMQRRRLAIATYNQHRAATYAHFADYYRTNYLNRRRGWRAWFNVYDQRWVREKIDEFQIMAQAHAHTARMLMGIEL